MTDAPRFETVALEALLRPATLVWREWLSPEYLRVRVAGPALIGFQAPGADDHVRLFFAPSDAAVPEGPEEWRQCVSREYTPAAQDARDGWVDFDFVLHGEGPGAHWATHAPVGSWLAVGGPRRTAQVRTAPQSWFLAGDATALPAITRYLAARSPGTRARVVLGLSARNRGLAVAADADTQVSVVAETELVETIAGLGAGDRPSGSVLGFAAAEASIVPAARELLWERWGLAQESTIIKGYWRAAQG